MAEWTQDNLQPLIDKYNEYLVSVGKSYAITLNGQAPTIKGFLSQGAIVLATDVWLKLREFAEWVVDEYDVADNQSGAELGTTAHALLNINQVTTLTLAGLVSQGTFAYHDSTYNYDCYLGASTSDVFVGLYLQSSGSSDPYALFVASNSPANYYLNYKSFSSDSQHFLNSSLPYNNSYSFYLYTRVNYYYLRFGATSIPTFPSLAAAVAAFQAGGAFSGITADTTTVSIPAALPDGTSWGGLAVEGVGDVATPQAVEDAIAEAVTAREQPVVQPVTITLAPDTEINPDNGDTDPPPVVITPFPPADPSAVELGQEILESFEAHFPFSVPWDLYKIFSRLDAEPVAPSWTLALPEVGGLEPVSIVIDVAETPFHALAPTFRAFVGIVICLGLLIAATKWIKR